MRGELNDGPPCSKSKVLCKNKSGTIFEIQGVKFDQRIEACVNRSSLFCEYPRTRRPVESLDTRLCPFAVRWFKKFLDTPSMLEFQENQNPNEKPIIWTDYHRINSTHFRSDSLDSDIGVLPDDPIVLSDLRNMRHVTCLIVADIDVGDKVSQPVFFNKI